MFWGGWRVSNPRIYESQSHVLTASPQPPFEESLDNLILPLKSSFFCANHITTLRKAGFYLPLHIHRAADLQQPEYAVTAGASNDFVLLHNAAR